MLKYFEQRPMKERRECNMQNFISFLMMLIFFEIFSYHLSKMSLQGTIVPGRLRSEFCHWGVKPHFQTLSNLIPCRIQHFFSWCHAWTVTIGQRRSTWRTWENSNGTRSESETKNQNGFMICILSLKTLICSRTCKISLQEYSNRPIKFAHFRFQVVKILSCRFHRRGLF